MLLCGCVHVCLRFEGLLMWKTGVGRTISPLPFAAAAAALTGHLFDLCSLDLTTLLFTQVARPSSTKFSVVVCVVFFH